MRTLVIGAVVGLLAIGCASASDFPADSTTTTTTTSASASTSSTVPAAPFLVFTVEQSGGCMMMGPNCAGYRFYSDGKVDVYRTDASGDTAAEITGSIAQSTVDKVLAELESADLIAIRAGLGEGECRGCYDGIDTTFIYETVVGAVGFSSTEVDLDESVPLFSATAQALAAAQASLDPLPIQDR